MKTERASIEQLMGSPAAYRDRLLIDSDDGPRRYGPNLDEFQREDFEAIDRALRRVVGQDVEAIQRIYCERHRGASKTTDIAVCASWMLFAAPRKITGVCCAADRDQAGLIIAAIDTLIRQNSWLAQFLEVQANKVVNKHSGSTLTVLSSDAASSYGLLCDFVIVDELSAWKSRDLWDSVFSTSAKRRHCCLLIISNAGFKSSWQYELREAIRTDPSWTFRRLEGFASWITPEHLEEQRRLLPAKVYDRLWRNNWSDGASDALTGNDIDAAVNPHARPWDAPERGWAVCCGLDIGVVRDSSALAVIAKNIGYVERSVRKPRKLYGVNAALADHGFIDAPRDEIKYTHVPGTGQLKLVGMHVWNPKDGRVQIEEIERTVLELNRRLRLVRLSLDPYQGEFLAQRLSRQGVFCDQVAFVPSNLQSMATATLDAFRERTIELYPHEELIQDLKAMQVIENASGYRLSMQKAGTAHGDAAQALVLAIESARSLRSEPVLHPNRRLVLN